ncbi:PARP-domain-containing protein [Neoconidiobolus thromboides FSU 785]|nr:PARP-domain-containing protein [Neoconidiobolus thromboides FSU 785]
MLNQTNLGQNNNKFFVLQLLVDTKNNYYVWARWGRVGVNGQTSLDKFNQNLDQAISKFTSKFFAKSGNRWQVFPYTHRSGKYFVMERDYEDDDDGNDKSVDGIIKSKDQDSDEKPVAKSKLEPRVYELVKRMFDVKMMNDSMSQFSYDTKKMPLGKLTKDHIKKSMQVLKDIAEELTNSLNKYSKLEELSSLFYTIIPHAYGMRRPPVIATKELLKNKLELVESLAEIQIANSLMKKVDEIDTSVNPIDSRYKALNNNIKPLDKGGKEFELIKEYVKNTHGSTHNWYDLEVQDAFELIRNGEDESFKKFESLHNRKLLWHGSRMTNFVGILSQGLRIAPPEAPVTGYMFGKGVYFADIVSKSANYCCSSISNNEGLMLLCEVALGDEFKLKGSDYYAGENSKNNKAHCTKGLGRLYPDPKDDLILENKTVVPKGAPISSDDTSLFLQYNEYIVYDIDQIKMKYLIKLKFNNK